MKILHICLSCFYIDNALYQENELVRQHVQMGHEVKVLASTETMSDVGALTYTRPAQYDGTDGAPVERLAYSRWLPEPLMRKLRAHPGVYQRVANFRPDVIIFHGACGWEIRTAARYARNNPGVRLFVDSHEDHNNSARTLGSRMLHRMFYRPLLRSALPDVAPILCISLDTIKFVQDLYGIPREQLEFFPLGGSPLCDDRYALERAKWRSKLALTDQQVAFLQTGKFDRRKRLLDSVQAFHKNGEPDFRLFISGVLADDEHRNAIEEIIRHDKRIKFLGWNNTEDLVGLLAAADVYLQPGTQSVSMQNSLCQRCAVVVDDVESHKPFVDGNGFLTNAGSDLEQIFQRFAVSRKMIPVMRERSYEIALAMLDYRKLALRLIP